MEGLSTAGNIQGGLADALLAILHSKSIGPALKWVDHFVFFRAPTYCDTDAAGMVSYSYSYDLASVMKIMDPLGIPWHPIEVKGQDFWLQVSYVGFMWNLELHTISLSPKKRTKYLKKVHSSLHTSNAPSRKQCTSILGTLQHISFIYRDGRSRLPPFVSFISKFPNDFTMHHAPRSIVDSLCWWEAVLLNPLCCHSLKLHQWLDPDLWVDVSTSWGIGIAFGNRWLAWTLTPGWKAKGRDIGWAESIALELAVLVVIDSRFRDCSIVVRGDNIGIIGAYDKGSSRNV